MDEENKEEIFEPRSDLSALAAKADEIRAEVGKIIMGQNRMVELLLIALLADGHVLIEGVPGVAKTLTAKVLSKTISVKFGRIQFTPDLMPSDVVGTTVFNMKTSTFDFNKGPVFTNLLLIDEINRAPAKTQSALFEVMEERQVTVDGTTYLLEPPFMAVATQNPIEQEGTYRLPEAQLDRFLFKINVDYPEADQEKRILQAAHRQKNSRDLSALRAVISAEELHELRRQTAETRVEDGLFDYITSIIRESRQDPSVYLGASPRAGVALLSAAKARAALSGRDFVTPEDVSEMAFPVLRHRLILTAEKEMDGNDTDAVIKSLLDRIKVPR